MTRDLGERPNTFEGKSRYNSLCPSGRPSAVSAALKGQFFFGDFVVNAYVQSLVENISSVVRWNPSASHVFGIMKDRVREAVFSVIYTSDGDGALVSYKFVGALLALMGKVTKGEFVAVEALISATV